jgi:hypothetical protein
MAVFWPVLGVALIAAIVWEVFNDLFQPSGSGALSDWLARSCFDGFKRFPRALGFAGPVVLLTDIALWVTGLVFGFALLYLDAYPAGFRTSTGTMPTAPSAFLSALHFSFETLITLGYGDLVPGSWSIRFLASTEGLVGFALLTASVSSIVLLYPALARMRLLARGVAHLAAAERQSGIQLAATGSDVTLSSLARDVTQARIDLIHFPIVYYFASADVNARVARWIGDLERFAREAGQPDRPPQVRIAATALDLALDDFANIVDQRFLHTQSRDRDVIFEALATDQLANPRLCPAADRCRRR